MRGAPEKPGHPKCHAMPCHAWQARLHLRLALRFPPVQLRVASAAFTNSAIPRGSWHASFKDL